VRWLAVSQALSSPSAALGEQNQRGNVTHHYEEKGVAALGRCRGSGRGLELGERGEVEYPEKRSGREGWKQASLTAARWPRSTATGSGGGRRRGRSMLAISRLRKRDSNRTERRPTSLFENVSTLSR